MAYNASFDMVEEGTNKEKGANTESKPTVPADVAYVGGLQKKSFVGKNKIEDFYFAQFKVQYGWNYKLNKFYFVQLEELMIINFGYSFYSMV